MSGCIAFSELCNMLRNGKRWNGLLLGFDWRTPKPEGTALHLSRRHLSATGSPLDTLTIRGEGEQTQNA